MRKDKINTDKKADMSIQVVVVAVIAIVVMIILISVFSNNIVRSNDNLSKCSTSAGGVCKPDCSKVEGGVYTLYSGEFSDCTGDNKYCCVRIG